MGGTPYAVNLRALVGPAETPCGGAPYGRMVATDLNSGKQLWSVPHGTMLSDIPGSVGMGGPIVTAGGVVFVGAARDAYLRAYDAKTGKELWRGALPAAPSGTPMTYVAGARQAKGRQYVVIAAGEDQHDDTLVAFALK
jgi:quinoprotein glucose dehydrogenase